MSKSGKKENLKELVIKDSSWWHIRLFYKSGHGALIVAESGAEQEEDYGFMNITKNPPTGYAYYETDKPINNKEEKSHIRLYLQRSKKKRFSKWIMKFELSEKDVEAILKYLNKRKKR